MTLYNEIYCKFDLLHESSLQSLPKPYKLELYEKYLNTSIGYFKKDCYKDLEKRTPYWYCEYNFIADGTETSMTLNPLPPQDCEFYIGYRFSEDEGYTEIKEYTYDNTTYTFTLPAAPQCNTDIIIIAYQNGNFDEDLNDMEINILAYGMLTCFNLKQIEKETLLKFAVYNSSTKAFSKAEHIKALGNIYDTIYYKTLKSMINEYTFKYANDKLYNLNGRDYMYNIESNSRYDISNEW